MNDSEFAVLTVEPYEYGEPGTIGAEVAEDPPHVAPNGTVWNTQVADSDAGSVSWFGGVENFLNGVGSVITTARDAGLLRTAAPAVSGANATPAPAQSGLGSLAKKLADNPLLVIGGALLTGLALYKLLKK